MKKIKFKLPAFSLAEALITLLIVCLITLASIPILTKKKRTVTNGTHGRWMCTLNSMGTYVSWSSSDPKGDPDKPDTWTLGCNFVPPVNVSTYNITSIGAGGNGADGESRLEIVADTNQGTTDYTPSTSGIYRILVVGAGGGGGAGANRDGDEYKKKRYGTGGAGASGAYIIADVKLFDNERYTLTAGKGGERVDAHTGGCSRNYATGEKGGYSSFYSQNDRNRLNIIAGGGNGGSRITCAGRGWCSDNCGGGNGGESLKDDAVTFIVNGVDKKADANMVVALGYGNAGQSGGCNLKGANDSEGAATKGGEGFDAIEFGIYEGTIGSGGKGSAPRAPFNTHHTNGAGGRVIVYKILRNQGSGGEAAEPEEKIFMYSKGTLDISLGRNFLKTDFEVLNSDKTLNLDKYRTKRTTRVDLKNNGKIIKSVISYPGNDGTQFEGDIPTKGENSYWTEDGGGAPAPNTCYEDGKKPVYEGAQDPIKVKVCNKIKCVFDPGDDESSAEIPSGYCVKGLEGCNPPQRMVKQEYALADNFFNMNDYKVKKYLEGLNQAFFEDFYKDSVTGLVSYNKILQNKTFYFSDKNTDIMGYYNFLSNIPGYNEGKMLANPSQRCFIDKTNRMSYMKTCVEEKDFEVPKKPANIIGYKTNYTCTNGGNAEVKAYGAGGGGGYAFAKPGFSSRGGKGAPGAVIIEW